MFFFSLCGLVRRRNRTARFVSSTVSRLEKQRRTTAVQRHDALQFNVQHVVSPIAIYGTLNFYDYLFVHFIVFVLTEERQKHIPGHIVVVLIEKRQNDIPTSSSFSPRKDMTTSSHRRRSRQKIRDATYQHSHRLVVHMTIVLQR